MKIRSLFEFEQALDNQFSWRKQEIATIGVELKSAKRNHYAKVLFRSGIVLLYAHWEGLIRYSAECFLDYIVRQGPSFKNLKPCFLFYAVKDHLDTSSKINLSNFDKFEKTMGLFLNPLDTKLNIIPKNYISTKENQNITSIEFRSIIGKLGLDYLPAYALREKLIDDKLLLYRNSIAHGEDSHLEPKDFHPTYELISEKVLDSLGILREQMVESIKDKKYLLI